MHFQLLGFLVCFVMASEWQLGPDSASVLLLVGSCVATPPLRLEFAQVAEVG